MEAGQTERPPGARPRGRWRERFRRVLWGRSATAQSTELAESQSALLEVLERGSAEADASTYGALDGGGGPSAPDVDQGYYGNGGAVVQSHGANAGYFHIIEVREGHAVP